MRVGPAQSANVYFIPSAKLRGAAGEKKVEFWGGQSPLHQQRPGPPGSCHLRRGRRTDLCRGVVAPSSRLLICAKNFGFEVGR